MTTSWFLRHQKPKKEPSFKAFLRSKRSHQNNYTKSTRKEAYFVKLHDVDKRAVYSNHPKIQKCFSVQSEKKVF